MQTTIPDLQAFFANELLTGMKFASVPIEDPPMMAPIRMNIPRSRQQFPRLMASLITDAGRFFNEMRLCGLANACAWELDVLFRYLFAERSEVFAECACFDARISSSSKGVLSAMY